MLSIDLCGKGKIHMQTNKYLQHTLLSLTLDGDLIKENEVLPRFEIFHDCVLLEEEVYFTEHVKSKIDWAHKTSQNHFGLYSGWKRRIMIILGIWQWLNMTSSQ